MSDFGCRSSALARAMEKGCGECCMVVLDGPLPAPLPAACSQWGALRSLTTVLALALLAAVVRPPCRIASLLPPCLIAKATARQRPLQRCNCEIWATMRQQLHRPQLTLHAHRRSCNANQPSRPLLRQRALQLCMHSQRQRMQLHTYSRGHRRRRLLISADRSCRRRTLRLVSLQRPYCTFCTPPLMRPPLRRPRMRQP